MGMLDRALIAFAFLAAAFGAIFIVSLVVKVTTQPPVGKTIIYKQQDRIASSSCTEGAGE